MTRKCLRVRETASAHASLQACTDLVHACTYDCTPAQASCTHAHRFASQHATVHTSTRLVQASTSLCTPAHESACMHVADARMQIGLQASTVLCRHANRFASEHADMQACTDLVHACMLTLQASTSHCKPARGLCKLAERRAGLHRTFASIYGERSG